MCGIAGYIDPFLDPGAGGHRLEAMARTIRHRGPDDCGSFLRPPAGLTMQRLAIIDPTSGHQPMISADGRYALVFNGEIYNWRDLRRNLEREGLTFQTQSDTEVLLALYQREGAHCLQRLNGMFAFAIWDETDRTMFLARDRMGVKPLYYAWDGRRFLFASEIKALLAAGVARQVSRRAMWDYLTLRYVPQPDTIWHGVQSLPPGHFMSIRPDEAPELHRYWDIPYGGTATDEAEFAPLFSDAVQLRMCADVPVGILLSGGLDSSAVAAAAVRAGHTGIHCFSVAFRDSPATDERPHARQVAAALGLPLHEIEIGPRDFTTLLPEMVAMLDQPMADLASVPLHAVCGLARQMVKVVLSGEGSDEILAGYTFDRVVDGWRQPPPSLWARLLGRTPPPRDLSAEWPPLHMTNYFESDEKRRLLREETNLPDSMLSVVADLARCPTRRPLDQILYSYCQSWLVEDLLMKADRMSMAHSLELRTPFLDYRLVEWAARAPLAAKVGPNAEGRMVTKRILRDYAAAHIPRAVIDRPKQGFPVPVYGWLSTHLRDFAHDHLSGNGCRLTAWMDPRELQMLLDLGTGPAATSRDQHRLWHLLILEIWARTWEPAS